MRGRPGPAGKGKSFAEFYYRNVAISEGCGCSELVIRRDGPRKNPDEPKKTAWPRRLLFWRSGTS